MNTPIESDGLSRWESEGGRRAAVPRDSARSERASLPRGWEFNRVYQSPNGLKTRKDGLVLDEAKCYWRISSSPRKAQADSAAEVYSVTFKQAQELRDQRFTFARFSTPVLMVFELPALLLELSRGS